ncbi:SET domain-containing protein [Aureobasidium pullulans]|nr:SET domain-containing protein [Aureobasidium pullulans]
MSHSTTDQSLHAASSMQTENKKKRRAGKKEQFKRQRRQELGLLDLTMDDEHILPVETPAFELRKAENKGLGLFAIRNIEPGERLIQEAPLFILPKVDTMNAAIVESFINLRPEQRVAYLKLSFHDTCSANQEYEAGGTSAAEEGTWTSTKVEDPGTPDDGIADPPQQDDRRSCASEMQPLPPKVLDSDLETGKSCRLPNWDDGRGDQSPEEQHKLELPESEATSCSPVHESRVDSPVQGSDETTTIWNVDGLKEALVPDSSDEEHQEQDSEKCKMTDSLAARIINIWRTNSYMLDDGIDLDYAGIGPIAARLNHSCIPNVYTAYNSTSGYITVQAIQPIAAGDELCTAYINGADKLRSERRAQLCMWGFECTCIACADGYDESRRREIKSLQAKVEEVKRKLLKNDMAVPAAQLEQTVGDLLDLATLMSDEGLLGPNLADICFGAARCCNLINRPEEAGALQSSGFGILLRGYGIDNPICSAALQAGDLDEA